MYGRRVWQTLGITATRDVGEIRAAYARALRSFDPDDDPKRFNDLRAARDAALNLARLPEPAETDDDADEAYDDDDFDEEWDEAAWQEARWRAPGHAETAPSAAREPSADALAPRFVAPAGIATALAAPRLTLAVAAPLVAPPPTGARLIEPASPPPADAPRRVLPPFPPECFTAEAGALTRVADGFQIVIVDTKALEARIDAHYTAVRTLLLPGGEPGEEPLSPEERLALDGHLDALLADPRLGGIEFHAEVADWFAGIVAATIPRSDPIIPRLIDFFGWEGAIERFDASAAVIALIERERDLGFLQQVSQPGHRFHRAWKELSRPDAGAKSFSVGKRRLRDLLNTVRRAHPRLEGMLNAYRVDRLENPAAGAGAFDWRVVMVLVWIVIAGVRVLSSFPAGPAPSMPPALVAAAPTTVEEAADPVLTAWGGNDFNLARIATLSPRLKQEIVTIWRTGRANRDTPNRLSNALNLYLKERAKRGFWRVPREPAANWASQRERVAAKLQASGNQAACVRVVQGKPDDADKDASLTAAEKQLFAAAIIAGVDAPPTKDPTSYTVAGPIIDMMIKESGLTEKAALAGFHYKGSDRDNCTVGRVMLRIALRLKGERGLYLLRRL